MQKFEKGRKRENGEEEKSLRKGEREKNPNSNLIL